MPDIGILRAQRVGSRPSPKAARYTAQRRSKRMPWYDKAKVQEFYDLAAWMRSKGVDACVDHVVPLLGEDVSGLHVQTNLAVTTAVANHRKGNRFDPTALEN